MDASLSLSYTTKSTKIPIPLQSISSLASPDTKQLFLKSIDGLLFSIWQEIFPALQELDSFKENSHNFILNKFISKQTLQSQGDGCEVMGKKAHQFYLEKAKLFQFHHAVQEITNANHCCLTPRAFDEIKSACYDLKKSSQDLWDNFLLTENQDLTEKVSQKTISPISLDVSSFVGRFNLNFADRKANREIGISILDHLRQNAWVKYQGVRIIPDIREISASRKALIFMYQTEDGVIKEQALVDLINLLEADPIRMESAYGLVDLQERLYNEIQGHKAQNLNIKLQRLLIKAYAITIECILLHSKYNNLNAIQESVKRNLWDSADEFADFNRSGDKEIDLWSDYASQGAQRLKTEVPAWMIWAPRIIVIVDTIIQLGALYEQPEKIFGIIAEQVPKLIEAFSYFEWHKDWFDELLALRLITRVSYLELNTFRKNTTLFQMKKRKITNKHILHDAKHLLLDDQYVLFGAISTLEHVIMISPSKHVQEEAIKLLLQYITLDNSKIQSRIIQTFVALLTKHEILQNTAFVLLKMIEASELIPQEDVWREVHQSPAFNTLGSKLKSMKTPLSKHIYHSVIKFLVRRLGEIKGEKDTGGQSFSTLICSSSKCDVAEKLLTCLLSLSPQFSQRNVNGNTPFHNAVLSNNFQMIQYAYNAQKADLNSQEFIKRNTALHLAINMRSVDAVKLLISLKADLTIENAEGETPLHRAVTIEDKEIVGLILKGNFSKNNLNIYGKTPLNIAIASDNQEISELLISHGEKIAEDINQITPIIYAAKYKAEKTLTLLINKNQKPLSNLEALEIAKMITRDGKNIDSSNEFCNFHLKKIIQDPNYSKAFEPYQNLLQLELDDKEQVNLGGKGKDTIGVYDVDNKLKTTHLLLTEQKSMFVDNYGNTTLMLLAKEKNHLTKFNKILLSEVNINASNVFGITALHVAVIFGNTQACQELIKHSEIQIDSTDINGFTPLHFAVITNNLTILNILLEAKADPNTKNGYGDTAFLIACGNFPNRFPESLTSITSNPERLLPKEGISSELLQALVAAGATPHEKDFLNNNALHHAVCYGSDYAIEYIFKRFRGLMWENNKKNLLPVEEAVLSERHIDFNTLLSKNTFDFLHCEFQKNTNNFLTLGNLLALANQKGTFKKLLKYDRSLAFHQDSTPLRFTPLHIAAKSGSIEILQVYQELKIDLNIEDGFGNTAAHIACLNNRHEFLDTITKFNIDLTKKNQDGRTALHIAATQIQTDCVELLSKNLELVRERDGDGNLPLHLSCKFLRNKNASILLNADPESKNVVNDDMNTPLHLACGSGDLETVSLLYNHGVGVELANIFGETPLIISALHGHGEIVDYLILNGVDILAQDLERETALHKAVFRQHKNVVLSLLEADKKLVRPKEKALVRIKDVDDEIPLHELPKFVNNPNYNIKNQIDILNKLLENGSKLTLKNERGESFFHLICYAGRKDVLEASLRYLMLNGKLEKFNPCSTDNKGHTFLHKAALGSHNHLIDYLISLKVPKNNADKEGYTPLFLAVKVGNYDFAKKLYEYGGHLKSSINIGQSIVHLSTQFKPPKILEQSLIHLILDREILCPESFKFLKWVLDKHPSLLFERDEEKRTPLHIIAERNHISALNLVLEWLPGSQEKNERYLWKKSASGFVAHEIAKNNQFYELERMIRNFPKDWLGSHHKKQSKVTQI